MEYFQKEETNKINNSQNNLNNNINPMINVQNNLINNNQMNNAQILVELKLEQIPFLVMDMTDI